MTQIWMVTRPALPTRAFLAPNVPSQPYSLLSVDFTSGKSKRSTTPAPPQRVLFIAGRRTTWPALMSVLTRHQDHADGIEYGHWVVAMPEDSFELTVFPGVILGEIGVKAEGQQPYCAGASVTLQITVFPSDAALVWLQNGSPLEQTNDTIMVNPDVADGSVVYTVQASTTDGCTATSLPLEIAYQRCLYIPNAFRPMATTTAILSGLSATFLVVEATV